MLSERSSVREALLWEYTEDALRCLTCERHCTLAHGQLGWCRTRVNRQGKLYTLIYGAVSSLSANPIEKKPLYHFYPGSVALTVGSYSCNFACPWCQNHHISKQPPPLVAESESLRNWLDSDHFGCPWCQNHHLSKASPGGGRYMSPEDFVATAIELRCQGTSISFNEPTLSLEWSLDVFRLAQDRGLYNTYVTNGYMTAEALKLLAEAGLDAMNVDVKGDAQAVRQYCQGIDVEKVWRNCKLAQELGVHLEITTLVIPGVNDGNEVLHSIARRIVAELGPDVPWHVSGYYPAYRFTAPPTPVETLESAARIADEEGLPFVYIGNVPGHEHNNTFCPACGAKIIERHHLAVTSLDVVKGRCRFCDHRIPGIWRDD